jgi:hypothetical protein
MRTAVKRGIACTLCFEKFNLLEKETSALHQEQARKEGNLDAAHESDPRGPLRRDCAARCFLLFCYVK